MTWNTASIKLAAAQAIFEDANIAEVKINDKTVGYTAFYRGGKVEDYSLTALCKTLWTIANLER
jgi:hypothetical protein